MGWDEIHFDTKFEDILYIPALYWSSLIQHICFFSPSSLSRLFFMILTIFLLTSRVFFKNGKQCTVSILLVLCPSSVSWIRDREKSGHYFVKNFHQWFALYESFHETPFYIFFKTCVSDLIKINLNIISYRYAIIYIILALVDLTVLEFCL